MALGSRPKSNLSPYGNFMPTNAEGDQFDPTKQPWFIPVTMSMRRVGPSGGKGKGVNKTYTKAQLDNRLDQVRKDIRTIWTKSQRETVDKFVARLRGKL